MTMIVLSKNPKDYALIPSGRFYDNRRKDMAGIVLHITAGLQDLGMVGDDPSAENTNRWQLSAKPIASWNAIADTDSCILCVPDWYTAWQCVGYNSKTVGIEISKLDTDWSDMDPKWVDATLRQVARWCAAIVKKYNLPLKLSTKSQVDAAIQKNQKFGFSYHGWLNPENRTDPGLKGSSRTDTFPIERLFHFIRVELGLEEEEDIVTEADMEKIANLTAEKVWAYQLQYPAQMLPKGSPPKYTTADRWLVHANRKAQSAALYGRDIWKALKAQFGWTTLGWNDSAEGGEEQ